MKTGILCHGLNLHTTGWVQNAWGIPEKGLLGRLPKAAQMAIQLDADMMIFGTGATEKDGMNEGLYSWMYLFNRLDSLPDVFPRLGRSGTTWNLHKCRIIGGAERDNQSTNTREEIANAFDLFRSKLIKRMVLVSCPTHLPRCLRDACAIGVHKEMDLLAVPSDVCFAGSTPDDVRIVEPRHIPVREVNVDG